jgi:hypothetical protein
MWAFIKLFFTKLLDYTTSPILYHVSCDGLVMNTFHQVSCLSDSLALTFTGVLFVGFIVYYRNTFLHIAGLLSDFRNLDRSEKVNTIFNLGNALYKYLLTFYTSVVEYVKTWRQ